jgi:CO dehydrogenase/acetyl-CoA synthase epsilon subunit
MAAMGIFFRGHTRLYIVLETVKVNEESFMDHILKRTKEKDIPQIYTGEEHKVTIHMDIASSHVCSETSVHMKSRIVKFFSGIEWMSKSPDLFSMTLGINSIFKNLLSEKRAFTLDVMKSHETDVV